MTTDRRRINGPPSGTSPPVFSSPAPYSLIEQVPKNGQTARDARGIRKMFLRTNLTPSASGSSYLEIEPSPSPSLSAAAPPSLLRNSMTPTLKLSCTLHGPKPLPRSAPFSPNLLLTAHVKFCPFSLGRSNRRGFVRESDERDLSAHLESALRGVVIGERWPKSGIDLCVLVLEAESESSLGEATDSLGMMNILSGCINVASTALVQAGVDCVDVIAGGVAALVRNNDGKEQVRLDPSPADHTPDAVVSACCVGYLSSRDELTELWLKGVNDEAGTQNLIDAAVEAALPVRAVIGAVVTASIPGTEQERADTIKENISATQKAKQKPLAQAEPHDVDMG